MADIGIVSPGKMGCSIAVSLINSGHSLYWASDGRSESTKKNAESLKIKDVKSLSSLAKKCQYIFCIGTKSAGKDTLQEIPFYKGVFIDANSMWGEESENLYYEFVDSLGINYVDAAIHGYPTWPNNIAPGMKRILFLYSKNNNLVTEVKNLFTDFVWSIECCVGSAKANNRKLSNQ